MAPVPEQEQCRAAVGMTHRVPVTQCLNQMRNILVPSSREVPWGDARRAQPVPFPQCQQLRVGVDVWWVTDLTLISGRREPAPTLCFEPAEDPPASFSFPQPRNTLVPLHTDSHLSGATGLCQSRSPA